MTDQPSTDYNDEVVDGKFNKPEEKVIQIIICCHAYINMLTAPHNITKLNYFKPYLH